MEKNNTRKDELLKTEQRAKPHTFLFLQFSYYLFYTELLIQTITNKYFQNTIPLLGLQKNDTKESLY